MTDKVIYAMYDDDDVTKEACQSLVDNGVHVADVFSPFPIHGIDPIIGIKHTRLGIAAFMYGITGLLLAIIATRYFMVSDWHGINIGGKPNFSYLENIPSFVPILFEFTVLCAAHGMALTYFLRNKSCFLLLNLLKIIKHVQLCCFISNYDTLGGLGMQTTQKLEKKIS